MSPEKSSALFITELHAAGDDIVVDGVFSHFSAPESLERDEEEYALLLEGIAQLESAGVQIPFKHISCSAASERYPKFDMDAVRIGPPPVYGRSGRAARDNKRACVMAQLCRSGA